MEALLTAIEDENFAHVKTLVAQNPELLTQDIMKRAEEIAAAYKHNNAFARRILRYLRSMMPAAAPAPAPAQTLMNLKGAVNRQNLESVRRILNAHPELLNEQYENVTGEPFTVLKRAKYLSTYYPSEDSPQQQIVAELRRRGGIVPVPAYQPPRREGLPPRAPNRNTIPRRNVTRGIATKGGRRRTHRHSHRRRSRRM